MVTDYKATLRSLSHEDLLRVIDITPTLVERMEVHLSGAKHSSNHCGPDGYFDDGSHVEVKTQKYTGNYTLRGRGKFGKPSKDLHDLKIASNELIIITGFDSVGKVYYRFTVTFDAVEKLYKTAADNKQCNYDFIPKHYANHHSFKVEYIAPADVLTFNKEKFQPKFLKFLQYLNKNNYTQPTNFY